MTSIGKPRARARRLPARTPAEAPSESTSWLAQWGTELEYIVRLLLTLNLGGLGFIASQIFAATELTFVLTKLFLLVAMLAFGVGAALSLYCVTARLDYYWERGQKAKDDQASEADSEERNQRRQQQREIIKVHKDAAEFGYQGATKALFTGAALTGLAALISLFH